ncbi:MAG: hypothetical protein O2857_15390 [Planctomycetota bacterium]|nr:hypothetical protein [Planctomycetota bacterium]
MLPKPAPFPPPRNLTRREGHYRFQLATKIVVKNQASDEEKMAGEWILNSLENYHSFHAATGPASMMKSPTPRLYLVDASSPGSFSDWIKKLNLPSDLKEEEAFIRADENGAIIAGGGPRGVFYGAQIFCELLGTQKDRPAIPFMEARSAPCFAARGIHLSLNLRSPDPSFIWRILGEMMRLRMNMLILKLNRGIQYESRPELAGPKALSRIEMLGILDTARIYGIRVVPQLDFLTGQDSFLLEARPDLVANPDHPFAYDPSIPVVHEIMEDVATELIDLFQPDSFHIGMGGFEEHKPSEILSRECEPSADIFRDELNHWLRFFEERNVAPIVSASGFRPQNHGEAPQDIPAGESGITFCLEGEAQEEFSCPDSLGLVKPSRQTLVKTIRDYAGWKRPPQGLCLQTNCPATELDFQRKGLLDAMEDVARLLWDPTYEPPQRSTSLSGLILRDA